MLSWRDLADVEAGGSEVHAAEVARLWAEAGLEVTLRTSATPRASRPPSHRDGYRVVRRAGRYLVFPRAVAAEVLGPPRAPRRAGRVLERHAVLLAAVGAAAVGRRAAPRARRDVEDGARRRDPDAGPRSATSSSAASRRSPTGAAASSRCPSRRRPTSSSSSGSAPSASTSCRPASTPASRPAASRSAAPARRRRRAARARQALRPAARGRAPRPARTVPDLELVIVGEGYERPALDELVAALDAEGWVTLRRPPAATTSSSTSTGRRGSSRRRRPARAGAWRSPRPPPAARRRSPPASPATPTPCVDGVSGVLADGTADGLGGALARVLADDALRAPARRTARSRRRRRAHLGRDGHRRHARRCADDAASRAPLTAELGGDARRAAGLAPLAALAAADLRPAAAHRARAGRRRHEDVPLPRPGPPAVRALVDVGPVDRPRHRQPPDDRLPVADGPVVLGLRAPRRARLGGPAAVARHDPRSPPAPACCGCCAACSGWAHRAGDRSPPSSTRCTPVRRSRWPPASR